MRALRNETESRQRQLDELERQVKELQSLPREKPSEQSVQGSAASVDEMMKKRGFDGFKGGFKKRPSRRHSLKTTNKLNKRKKPTKRRKTNKKR